MGVRKRFQSSTVEMDAVLVGTPPPLKVIWGMSGSLVVEQNRTPSNRKKIGRNELRGFTSINPGTVCNLHT